MNIDDYIRDFSFKIIDGKALIGIEVESKYKESLYYNILEITFLKNGKEVHKEETDVPLLPAGGLVYVGRCYDFTDFDEIKLHMISIEQVYENSYYPNVEFGIDEEKTNGKHLEYKVVNNNNVPIPSATLSLLFYNRGELVCGADVKLGKLINGRTYYFVYDVPEGLVYTDVNTELTLPNTGYLLFKSYYKDYLNYEKEIDDLSVPYQLKSHETLEDIEESTRNKIKQAEKQIEIANSKGGFGPVMKTFLKNLFFILLKTLGVELCLCIVMVGLSGTKPIQRLDTDVVISWIVVGLISFIIFTVKAFKNAKKAGKLIKNKDKKKIINDQNKKIDDYKDILDHFLTNKDKMQEEINEKNKKIDEENVKIKEDEERRVAELKELQEEFKEFKSNYPEYKEFDDYNGADRLMCEAAFASGALTFDAVKECRNIIKEKLEQEKKYQEEMAMRRKEQQLMAEQTEAIKRQADAQRYASQQIEAAIREQAQMQRAMINEQIAASDRAAKAAASATAQVNMNLNSLNSKYQQDLTYYR